jgi:pilus assembly protein CpaB
MKRQFRGSSMILSGVLLGMVSAYLIWRYLTELDALRKENWKQVVVATTNIKPHTVIARNMITLTQYPRENIAADAVTDIRAVEGRVAHDSIKPQDQIRTSDLVPHGHFFDLSDEIAPGKRATTISANEVNSVGNTIMPGNRVDVLVSYHDPIINHEVTVPVLQNVRVLAVDKGVTQPADGRGASTSVTMEIPPEEGVLLTVADRAGALRVMLRTAGDDQVITTGPTSSEDIIGKRRNLILEALTGVETNRVVATQKPRHIVMYSGTISRIVSPDE